MTKKYEEPKELYLELPVDNEPQIEYNKVKKEESRVIVIDLVDNSDEDFIVK